MTSGVTDVLARGRWLLGGRSLCEVGHLAVGGIGPAAWRGGSLTGVTGDGQCAVNIACNAIWLVLTILRDGRNDAPLQ